VVEDKATAALWYSRASASQPPAKPTSGSAGGDGSVGGGNGVK
jgi:hypothetical protein